MKIGIDLDGVVFDTEKEYRVYTELYDMLVLKQNSKIDNSELRFQDRFKWTEENSSDFLTRYHEKITREANYMPGAKDVLQMLKQDGHKLIMITARGGMNKRMIEITKERLNQDNMEIFDKYYFDIREKQKICLEEKIDVMIDDYYRNCQSISDVGIKTIYLKDAPSRDLKENEYLKVLYNWGEIYRYIKEIEK